MNYLMGIDLGTSSVKVLITTTDGTIVSFAQKGYEVLHPAPQFAEQDLEQLWSATASAMQEVIHAFPYPADQIKGIGLSGQMHGLVALDSDCKPVQNCIIWLDQRTQQQINDIYHHVSPELIRSETRNRLSPGFLLASLLWIKENRPQGFSRIRYVMLPKDYIRYRLCAQIATDVSDASGTLAFNVAQRKWSSKLISAVGLPMDMFPPVGESCEIVGHITDATAETLGLAKETPVVFGGGDTPMQALGNGMIANGIVSANIGTASQIASVIDEPLYDPHLRTNTFCASSPQKWIVMGASLNGGCVLSWLRENVFSNHLSFPEIDQAAQAVSPGCDGLICLPYLSGERTPHMRGDLKGIFYGLTLQHGSGEIARATMEGMVFALKDCLCLMQDIGIPITKIVSSGGGSRGVFMRQLLADILGYDIYSLENTEQACLGAAMAAGIGTGTFSSVEDACARIVRIRREVIHPNASNVARYQEIFARYRYLYVCNKPLFDMQESDVLRTSRPEAFSTISA